MKKLITLIIVLAIAIILSYVIAHSEITAPKETQPASPGLLSVGDVSLILSIAIKDIEKQGCEPLFLSERGGFIWVRCKDTLKMYRLDKWIEAYQAQKDKVKETPDVKTPDRD